MKNYRYLILAIALSSTQIWAGEWVAEPNPAGPGWTATNGKYLIETPDEKSAKKVAKNMNKADKKSKKKKGVYDDGSGACDDPRINC
ncbi:MAG: hypothetical protein P8163_08555 [Candidatus Thiodiazotropha sp.]